MIESKPLAKTCDEQKKIEKCLVNFGCYETFLLLFKKYIILGQFEDYCNQFSPHGHIPFVHWDRLLVSGNTGIKLVGDHLSRGTKFFGTFVQGARI